MRIAIAGLTAVLASGCVLDTSQPVDDLATASSVAQAVTILPQEGFWAYDEVPPITTNCDSRVPDTVSGLIFISHLSATSYRVFPSAGSGLPPFTCTVTGAQFTCPNIETEEVDVFGLVADLTFLRTATGVHTNPQTGTGKQDVAVSCSGFQCFLLSPMPCGFVHNFNVRKL